MTFDFRAELDVLARRIEQNPMLELFSFEVCAPVSEEAVKDAEARFGAPLPAPLRRLYRTLGSATLQWCFRSSLDEQNRQQISEKPPNTIAEHGLFDGSIGIASLENVLFNPEYTPLQLEYESEFIFDGTVYGDNEFCRMVRHFDTVDDCYAMSFIVQPDRTDWKMMLLGDYWIEYDYSRVAYLEDYLRYVIATWGLVDAREELFSEYRGDLREPLRFDPDLAAARVPTILSAM
ncbi:SMI1/KNR4 family protein [Actinomadura xylanilytica]|uniref:SMI1/KNR4 family protein n=1 Tax=Actinomadura xylanilytica TaxID=887459 RepID=UPI00255AC7FC|nr:SMI1/KNR4 family protein [Actinomadura xylanilytica]MDL4773859.1 SMI1/KNR4 family protein [Actinomadura xylanilytica]